ncbi:MAG TPA: ECF-type sigma factor [Verrucomicrobiae bacterium]|nr:ECF-type sigma factor [Verrucomicrobiae bacterium]
MTEDCGEKSVPDAVSTWSTRLYHELRQLAASQLSRHPPGQTLQATALVHEAWLKLGGSDQHWQNRAHFFGAAAQAMRQILIDQARRKAAVRHGGGQERAELNESKLIGGAPDEQLLEVNEALDRLAAHDPVKAELVKLRFFVGLSLGEAAEVLGISEPTARRYWTYARAWLFRELRREGSEADAS